MPNGDPLIIGQANTESQGTLLNSSSADWNSVAFTVQSTNSAVRAVSENAVGMFGRGLPFGTVGSSPDGVGVEGVSGSGPGVIGHSDGNYAGVAGHSYRYVGVYATGQAGGVLGRSNRSPGVTGTSTDSFGVLGISDNSNGVWGQSVVGHGLVGISDRGYGVYARSRTSLAGRFIGDIEVSGNVYSGSKPFRIDHPLDPENKYLTHVAVESPQIKTSTTV